jgi:hypothetical protein
MFESESMAFSDGVAARSGRLSLPYPVGQLRFTLEDS